MNATEYRETAIGYFKDGFNCAQAVLLTFADVCGLDRETALKLSSSFGGGMGRLREVCGAVSGMFMAAGLLYGYSDTDNQSAKTAHYTLIQQLADSFRRQNGSIVCRELLGLTQKSDCPIPESRNDEYYKKRPCAELVGDAAEILAEYIESRKE